MSDCHGHRPLAVLSSWSARPDACTIPEPRASSGAYRRQTSPSAAERRRTRRASGSSTATDGLTRSTGEFAPVASLRQRKITETSGRLAHWPSGGCPVLVENVVLTGQAACWYSWMTPPTRSRLRTRKASRSVTSAGSGLSGAALDGPCEAGGRCGDARRPPGLCGGGAGSR